MLVYFNYTHTQHPFLINFTNLLFHTNSIIDTIHPSILYTDPLSERVMGNLELIPGELGQYAFWTGCQSIAHTHTHTRDNARQLTMPVFGWEKKPQSHGELGIEPQSLEV